MPKNRKKRKASTEKNDPRKTFIQRLIRGGIYSSLIFFALLFVLAMCIVKTNISDSMQNIFVFFFALLASFSGAFISLRKTQEKGLVSGLLVGFVVIVISCLVLLATVRNLGARTLVMSALMLLGGALGGIIAVNKQNK